MAVLPAHFSFVAKRAFVDQPGARIYLRGLGVQFVERFDTRQSVEDARRLADAVKAGTSVAFFPEGTFRRTAGRGPIVVTICNPVFPAPPAPDDFAAAVRLRDAARACILAYCGEPDAGSD
ncbi:MAG: 1-acyl-sn-glycerol-3-phosphate acyltransferase [Burkholderiales bacterium]